ncbi:MAG: M28 family peptidase [Gemmatimonadota bacterium]
MTAWSLLAVPGLLCAQAAQDPWATLERPRTHVSGPTRQPITAADLSSRLYRFADDSMGGRLLGTEGNSKGVEYIANEVKQMGLEPAGENGSYFQTIPVFSRPFDSTAVFGVGDSHFTAWTDYLPRDQGPGARSLDGAQVIYGGTWGDSASLISPDAVAGKLVLLSVAPAGYSSPEAPGTANRFQVSGRYPLAAGIAVAGLDLFTQNNRELYHQAFQGMRPDNPQPAPTYLYVTRQTAEAMLGAPLDSAKAGATGRTLSGTPRFIEEPLEFPGRNVVAILRGRDPVLRGEFVAIGAHNDHIGTRQTPVAHDSMYVVNHLFRQSGADDQPPKIGDAEAKQINDALAAIRQKTGGASARPDSIYNGADDDGSGSVSVLEIAQYFAGLRTRPKRSLLFVWHVGEEEGLYGSQYFTDHPTVPRDSIVAQLNIDMIGRGGVADVTGQKKEGGVVHGDPNYVQLIGSRRLSTELGDLAVTVNKTEHPALNFDYTLDANGHPQNIYCRSDHYEYARYGIPIIFFTTGGHADYHQVTDEPQYIDYARMARIANLVADLATTVANLDHRVVVDQPKPDPQGNCQQ